LQVIFTDERASVRAEDFASVFATLPAFDA
jgi:hypothetical protein